MVYDADDLDASTRSDHSEPVSGIWDNRYDFLFSRFYKYLDGTIYGSCCLATKQNEDKLQFIGYSNFSIRFLGFVIANTTTALAGAMYAVYLVL